MADARLAWLPATELAALAWQRLPQAFRALRDDEP